MTKKRKTKQLRWLVTMMMLAMTMVMPASTWAQVMYTVFDNGTLTFKYGDKPESGNVYDVPTDPTHTNISPDWLANTTSITTVVFDESFKDARPTSCYKWFYNCSKLTSIKNIENLNTANVKDMGSMFNYCSGLTSLDLSSFNTAKVESMNYMFDGCSSLTSLDLSSFNTAEVKDMGSMFGGCSGLTSLDLSSFNTAKVENMSYMFYGCSRLTTIYVSDDFKIGNFTDGPEMFTDCKNLEGAVSYSIYGITDKSMANCTSGYFTKSNLTPYVKWDASTKVLTFKVANYTEGTNGEYKLNEGNTDPGWCINEVKNNCKKVVFTPSFNHAKPTSCYKWFDSFSNLTTIQGIENLNTDEVTDMIQMFGSCQKLTSLDLSSFNTAKVTNMSGMFYNCSSLTSLDLSSFNTAKVENMSYMFSYCSGLTTIYASDAFTTSAVSNGSGMFTGCSNLKGATSYSEDKTGIDMANFDGYFTPKTITPYVKWDANTKVLTFKVANNKEEGSGVYDLNDGANAPGWVGEVYSDCEEVVFTPSFKQAKPTSCYMWFEGFEQLKVIEGIEYLNTEKVTNMSHMFAGCKDLTSLDLSSFNTAEVTNMSNMFVGCSGLLSLGVSSFNTANVTDMSGMFVNCSNLTSLDLSSFNTAKVEVMGFMFNGCSGLTTIYVSDDFTTSAGTSGLGMFEGCRQLKGAASYDPAKTGIDMANFDGYFTPINITPYVKWDVDTKVLTFKVANTKEAGNGVYDLNQGANDPGWFIDEVKNNCTKVVFTSSFNHAKPTSCYKWFLGFGQLTTIEGIENLNTEEVKNMSYMFYNCRELTSLNLSSFYTANVTNMSYMFSDCPILTSLTLSSFFNTANVTDMSYMFCNCEGLTSLTLSSFNTDKVENMSYMFYNCQSLESLILSSFNTANVKNMSYMFNNCKKLKSLDLSNFDTSNVTNMFQMFYECSGLKSLNLSSFNTAKVTNMGDMFYECSGLTSLDVSKFNTAKVTNMNGMFNSCSGLTSLNLSNFNTANVTNMGYMFNGCSGLTSLNLSSFNTAKVEDMYQMFWGCSSLESINLSSFNTANVTRMGSMFKYCSSLTSLDLSSFNTAKVTNMSGMFWGCSGLTSLDLSSFNTAKVTNMGYMFSDCSGLENLDLSSFNTAEVTDMHYMFPGCSGLTTIYVSDDFTTGDGTDGHEMFKDCTILEGAAKYSDSGNTGIEMANYTTGYFKTYFTLGVNKVELCGEQLTTNSLNLSGEKDFVAHAPFTANEAKYSRDLSTSESTWFSLCLPFAYTPDNFTAYQLKGATEKAVEIEEITGEIVAGTPVLFKFKDGAVKEINLSATGANIVKAPVEGATVNGDDGSSLQLCGTYQTKTFSSEDGNAFILLNDKLMNPAKMLENKNVSKVSVKPFRAYMTLTASAQTSSARAFSIGHGDEGNEGTTAIDLLNSVATDDAEYYDINGRRIDAPAKGVNIVRRGNKTIKLIIK